MGHGFAVAVRLTSCASSAWYATLTASALCARSFVAGSSPPHHGPWPSTHASTAFAGRLGRATATAAALSATRRSKLSAVAPAATSKVCQRAQILQRRIAAALQDGRCSAVGNYVSTPAPLRTFEVLTPMASQNKQLACVDTLGLLPEPQIPLL